MAVAKFLAVALRPPSFWWATDHGAGKMTPASAGLLKARGGQKGMPDLTVIHPRERFTIIVGIELKAGKGKPTDEQMAVAQAFARANAAYEFCWSLEDVVHALRSSGIPVYAQIWGKGVKVEV